MTFYRSTQARGGNGRTRMGKFWVVAPQDDRPMLRTVYHDNQGYFINLDYHRAEVTVDADGVWHVTAEERTCPSCGTRLWRSVAGDVTQHYVYRVRDAAQTPSAITTPYCPACKETISP